jgi:hypothetical protein
MRRSVLCAVAAALIAAPAPRAHADADPPSDYLYGVANDLYLPADRPTPERETARLQRLLARARAIGHPYKLAIVVTRADLGAVPVYIDKPQAYAKFLYGEIGFDLAPQRATLLVVLPNGMGIAGQDAAVGRGVVAKLRVAPNATTTQLAHTAAHAVQAVAAANGHPITFPSPHNAGAGGGVGWWVWAALFIAALGAARLTVSRLQRRAG